VSVPFVYWKLDNDITSARFLTEKERAQALERLRANQGGVGSREFKWSHVLESLLDIKTYFWIGMSLGSNLGAQVTVTFGPLILNGLGFDKYTTSLLNMPFGAIQFLVIMGVAYFVGKVRWKSVMLVTILLPILVGLILLYVLPRTSSNAGPLLLGFYLLAFIFGCNTLIVSWVMANTAGQTKKSVSIVLYAVAASAGNIIGPLLYTSSDAPSYHPGLRSTLGVYVMIICIVIMQAGYLIFLNKLQKKKRVANGKPAEIHDHSMEHRYVEFNADNDASLGNNAFADLTDKENDEFIYVY
jgi:MFS family permease